MTLLSRAVVIFVCVILLKTTTSSPAGDYARDEKETLRKATELFESNPTYVRPSKRSSTLQETRKEEFLGDRTHKINRNFERMIQFVNILGQVDSFINDRVRNLIMKIQAAYDIDDSDSFGRGRSAR
ncbi:uncharacterized protein [Venturia canescens]|uniref:uncharacterized protein n=1 Tax=Venturia canescens TaxID=32260 RepID=UPI001C9CEE34|nr:uncharacterized protein LOC122419308 [Venturia canescens]